MILSFLIDASIVSHYRFSLQTPNHTPIVPPPTNTPTHTHTPRTLSQLSVAEAALKLLADDAELANLWAYCHGAPMILGWWQAAVPSCPVAPAASAASIASSAATGSGLASHLTATESPTDGTVSSASQDLLDDIGAV